MGVVIVIVVVVVMVVVGVGIMITTFLETTHQATSKLKTFTVVWQDFNLFTKKLPRSLDMSRR